MFPSPHVNKLWYSHTIEYHLAIKKNEHPTHVTHVDESQTYYAKWKKLDSKCYRVHLYDIMEKRKPKGEKSDWCCQGQEVEGEIYYKKTRGNLGQVGQWNCFLIVVVAWLHLSKLWKLYTKIDNFTVYSKLVATYYEFVA